MIGEFKDGIVMYKCPNHDYSSMGTTYFPIEVSDEMAMKLKENALKAWSLISQGIKY